MAIPLGCKYTFDPNDAELLVYLECKSMGVALPGEGFIKEVDLYSLSDPGVLFRETDEKHVYVFTKLKKVAKKGKRVERTVSGNRCWKGVDGGKPIYDSKGFLVGEKKNFFLTNKMKMKLGYNMIEFSLDKEILENSKFKDYVVCKIKKKAKKLRGLDDENFPEAIQDFPAQATTMAVVSEQGYICPSYVPMEPAIEGNTMVPVSEQGCVYTSISARTIEGEVMGFASEVGYLYQGNSTAVRKCPYQYQYQGEEGVMAITEEGYQYEMGKSQQEEEALLCPQVSESHQEQSNFKPMLCGDFTRWQNQILEEVKSWTFDDALAALDKVNGLSSSGNTAIGSLG